MKYEEAIAKLEQHAQQCEDNAVIQRREGNWKEADYNDGVAAGYRAAVAVLKAE